MKHTVLKLISQILCLTLFLSCVLPKVAIGAEIIEKSDVSFPSGEEKAKLIYSQSDFSSGEYSSPKSGAVDEFFSPTDDLWSVAQTDSDKGSSLLVGRNAYWTLSDAFSKIGNDTPGTVHQISFDFMNTNFGHIYFYLCTVGNVRLNKGGLRVADGELRSVQDYGYTTYGSISMNRWYNIKITYDADSDIAYVSVNDVIVDSYHADFDGELYSILFQRNDGTKAYIDNIRYTVWNNKYNYGVMKLTGTADTKYTADLRWMAEKDEQLYLIIAAYSDDEATKMTSSSYALLDISEGENNLSHTHIDPNSVTAKAFLWRESENFLIPVAPNVSLDNSLEFDSKLPLELTFDNTYETSYSGCDIESYRGSKAISINASTAGEVRFDAFVKGDYVLSFDIASSGVFGADFTIYGGGTPISLLEFDTDGNIKTKKGNIIESYDSEYTTITLVYDADAYTFDIYADKELIIKKYYPAASKTDKCVYFAFDFDANDDTVVYLDNIIVYPTYMQTSKCFIHDPWASPDPEMKVVVPATETWFSDETDEIEFMKDKVSFHKRSGLVCAYGEKFKLTNGFYEKNDEIMVPTEFFTLAFGMNVTQSGNIIYVGDNIRLSLTGNTMKVGNINYGLSSPPEEKEVTIYLPLKTIVTKGLSMYMYSDFDTIHSGLIVFSDNRATFPKGDALQRLNDYCFYERPTAERWLSDYNKSPLKGVHPRVMATKEDFERIREEIKTNSHKKRLYDKLISYCNSKMNKSPLKYELRDGVRLMYVSDDFMNWVISYAFAYQITGDVTYFNAAWKQIEAVSQMPDWNPVHHIDVGIMALGYGIAYDWFYDIMSEEQRNIMEKCVYNNLYWIVNEAFKSLDTPYEDPGMKDNHNVYCNAGLIACVVAFMDVYPDIGSHLGAGAMRLLERFMHLFAPYGSYFEGPSYASVSINYTSRLFASMKETMGTLYGLDKAEAFELSGDYIINMQSDVASFGFGDGDSGLKECVGTFWIYDHYGIKGRHETLAKTLYGANGADAVSALLYYDINDTPLDPESDKLDYYYPGEDIIVSRNNYDAGQVFVGMKLGGTIHSHSHLDFGSFVFDANGKRWAHDLGADDYNLEYNWGFYDIFRRRPESHNTLLINPDSSYGFDLRGRAKLISYESDRSGLIAKTDMTTLYGNKVTSAKRSFFHTDNRQSLVVRDEVTLTADADLYWLMYIDSNMEYIGNNTIILTDKRYTSKKIKIEFSSSEGETVIGTEAAVPFPDSPQIPEQNSNYGYKRLYYKVRGSGNVDITVKITPYNVDGTPLSDYNISMDNWSLIK